MVKVSTGIPGLNKMLNGGLIPNRIYLVKGGPGTGKTILGIQFLTEGVKNNEKCLHISLEESIEELKENMRILGIETDGIKFIDASPTNGERFFGIPEFSEGELDLNTFKNALKEILEREKPERLVIDSISFIKLASKSDVEYRKFLLNLFRIIKKMNSTAIIISEQTSGIEDFLANGIIELLHFDVDGKFLRGIRIQKMRGSDFDEFIRPYKIQRGGLTVFSDASFFG